MTRKGRQPFIVFAGHRGVGLTETARALAESLDLRVVNSKKYAGLYEAASTPAERFEALLQVYWRLHHERPYFLETRPVLLLRYLETAAAMYDAEIAEGTDARWPETEEHHEFAKTLRRPDYFVHLTARQQDTRERLAKKGETYSDAEWGVLWDRCRRTDAGILYHADEFRETRSWKRMAWIDTSLMSLDEQVGTMREWLRESGLLERLRPYSARAPHTRDRVA